MEAGGQKSRIKRRFTEAFKKETTVDPQGHGTTPHFNDDGQGFNFEVTRKLKNERLFQEDCARDLTYLHDDVERPMVISNCMSSTSSRMLHGTCSCECCVKLEVSNEPSSELRNIISVSKHKVCKVFVWDLDETLIIFATLLNGKFAEAYNGLKDPSYGVELGKRWEELINDVCDSHLFYQQVEDYNEANLEHWRNYKDGVNLSAHELSDDHISLKHREISKQKIVYWHQQIGELYKKGLASVLMKEQMNEWEKLYETTNSYTDGWLHAGRKLLMDCLAPDNNHVDQIGTNLEPGAYVNVIVTSGSLVPSLAKCLLFKLDEFISPENVYSSRECGKQQCFQWIKDRFCDPSVQFCAIGDDLPECDAAEALGWPFVLIETKPDGFHRLTTLSRSTIECYIKVVYEKLKNTR